MMVLLVSLSGQTHCKHPCPHHTVKLTRFLFMTTQFNCLFDSIPLYTEIFHKVGFPLSHLLCYTYKGTLETPAIHSHKQAPSSPSFLILLMLHLFSGILALFSPSQTSCQDCTYPPRPPVQISSPSDVSFLILSTIFKPFYEGN